MKTALRLALPVLLLSAAAAHAQMYKWVDQNGRITYSDVPPPASVKNVEQKSIEGSSVSTAGLPYELAQVVRNNPVTLYTTASCPGCDRGRDLLKQRGIPYSEKTVSTSEDLEQLRHAGGSGQLPMLHVGHDALDGFNSESWNTSLTAAGYPTASLLPRTYAQGAATPAAPAAAKAATAKAQRPAAAPQDSASQTAEQAPAGNAPPGFRF